MKTLVLLIFVATLHALPASAQTPPEKDKKQINLDFLSKKKREQKKIDEFKKLRPDLATEKIDSAPLRSIDCAECNSTEPTIIQPTAEMMEKLANHMQEDKPKPDACKTTVTGMNALCYDFVDQNCMKGKYGKYIKMLFDFDYTSRTGNTASMSFFVDQPPSDVNLYCKNYMSFTRAQKENFWIWVVMSVAMDESTCGMTNVNRHNRNAVGLLQLHKSNNDRSKIRPLECSDAFIKESYPGQKIIDPLPNLHCGLAMLAVQMAVPGGEGSDIDGITKGKLFSNGSYWDTLRITTSAGKKTQKLVKKFPGCF